MLRDGKKKARQLQTSGLKEQHSTRVSCPSPNLRSWPTHHVPTPDLTRESISSWLIFPLDQKGVPPTTSSKSNGTGGRSNWEFYQILASGSSTLLLCQALDAPTLPEAPEARPGEIPSRSSGSTNQNQWELHRHRLNQADQNSTSKTLKIKLSLTWQPTKPGKDLCIKHKPDKMKI